MEEELIKVKEEPLDSDNESEQEQKHLQQQEQQESIFGAATSPALPTATIKVEDELIIKSECVTEDDFCRVADCPVIEIENMDVVDEQADIITVNAYSLKSEDEQKFINGIVKKHSLPLRCIRKKYSYEQTCSKCQQTFSKRRIYEKHVDIGMCAILENKQKCGVCPLTFGTQAQLDAHLELHKLNRFFCGKHCGKYFEGVEQCELHEYSDHPRRNILCSICNHKFPTCEALVQHKQSHSSLKRYVCSFCREWFSCSVDLAIHWQANSESCGKLMQDIESENASVIEASPPVSNSDIRIGQKRTATKRNVAQEFKPTPAEAVEPKTKRCRVITRSSNRPQSLNNLNQPYISLSDIQIKEEPKSDTEIEDDLQSLVTNATTTNLSDLNLVFKEEPEEDCEHIQIKKEPIDPAPDVNCASLNDSDTNAIAIAAKSIISNNTSPTMPKLVLRPNLFTIPATSTMPSVKVQSGSFSTATMSKLKLVRLPNLQPASTMQTSGLKPLQLKNQNVKITPINFKGLKIYKLMPNAKLLRLPVKSEPAKFDSFNAASTITACASSSAAAQVSAHPIIVRLKQPQTADNAALGTLSIKVPAIAANDSRHNRKSTKTTTIASKALTIQPTVKEKAVTITLKSLAANTTIDTEDLKKLVTEASAAARCSEEGAPLRKNLCKSRTELKVIESLPQKRQLINNLKQQIKRFDADSLNNDGKPVVIKIENEDNVNVDDVEDDKDDEFDKKSLIIDEEFEDDKNSNISGRSAEHIPTYAETKAIHKTEEIPPPPPTFYLPITTESDPELTMARKLYAEYRYVWKCPRCPRYYSQKYSFRGHLVSAHTICSEEFRELIIEVQPLPRPKSKEELNPVHIGPPHSESESESMTTTTGSPTGEQQDVDQAKRRKSTSKFTCAKCGRTCSTRTALNDHVLGNCSREPQYPCPTCPKRFYSASTLNSHMSIHTGALPHKCSYCDKRFRTRGQVTVHHRTHTGERPFVCQICGQSFTHRETLISHLSRHIGMKRYKCYACNQQFSCISGLKTHREVRYDTCGKVKLNTRAIGPRVRVIKGNVIFEAQPEINPYLRTEDPEEVLAEINQNKKIEC